MASTTSSRTFESWTFAGLRTTASGTPRWSVTTWRFEPAFPLSVGFGPVLFVPLFADTLAESREILSQSIRLASPRRSRSTRCSSSHTPASCQSRKRRQQVEPDPQPISLGSFIKKGQKSIGVKRQYTGTTGKRENCQVGVFLAYASPRAQAFIDRELYLPEEGALDGERRERAGVPEQIGMRTKPELAKEMLGRALDAGVKAGWVVADSVYGDTRRLGMFLEVNERLRLPLNPPFQDGFERWLLVRCSIGEPDELTAYTLFAPEGTTLEELASVAGSRWRVEIGFEEAKGEVGLSHYELRSWHGFVPTHNPRPLRPRLSWRHPGRRD